MATTTIGIDDRDSSITYSRPASGGHWSNQSSRVSDAFQSTLKLTRTRNASAKIPFRGTSITVVGVIEDGGSSKISPSSSYEIDGRVVKVYNGVLAGADQYHVEFFKSDPLPMGQHTLVVTNLAEGSFFWLDEFIITQGPEPVVNPPIATPNSNPTPTIVTVVAPVQTIQPDSTVITSSSQTISQALGSTVVVQGSSKTTIFFTETTLMSVTAHGPLPSSDAGAGTGASGSNVVGGVFVSTSRQTATVPVGAIIGGVLGGLALILGILVVFLWRRRRSRQEKRMSSNRGENSTWGGQRSQQVSPFTNMTTTSPTGSPMSQVQETASSSAYGSGDSSTAALGRNWRETLGMNAPAIGKRQLAAMNANAVSPSDVDDILPSYLPKGRLRAGEYVLDTTSPSMRQKS